MFYNKLIKTRWKSIVEIIDRFYGSYLYMGIITLLIFLCSIFSFEYALYDFIVLFCVFIPLFICSDYKAALPPFFLCYYSLSYDSYVTDINSPDYFFSSKHMIHLYILAAIIVNCFIARFIYNLVTKKVHKPTMLFYNLLPFALILCLGGLGFEKHVVKDFYYGGGVAASYLVPFAFTTFLIDHKKTSRDYFFALMTAACLLISAQTLYCFGKHFNDIITTGFNGDYFRMGWGIKNNLGGMIVLSLLGPLYFASVKKYYVLFLILNFICFGCAVLTMSRNALLIGVLVEVIYFVYAMVALTKRRKPYLYTALVIMIPVLFILFVPGLLELISPSTAALLHNFSWKLFFNGRVEVYSFGLDSFSKSPVIGTGYYYIYEGLNNMYTTTNFPFRYHNTIFQVLASTGTLGIATLLLHRLSTFYEAFKEKNLMRQMLGLLILIFVLLCFGDCHAFNIGPGIFMGIAYGFLDCASDYPDQADDYLKTLEVK